MEKWKKEEKLQRKVAGKEDQRRTKAGKMIIKDIC